MTDDWNPKGAPPLNIDGPGTIISGTVPLLDYLEELAKEAAPGPWEWDDKEAKIVPHGRRSPTDVDRLVVYGGSVGYENARLGIDEENARYIAAASPDVVLALIRVARAAEQWREADCHPECPAYHGGPHDVMCHEFDAINALTSALDALDARKP